MMIKIKRYSDRSSKISFCLLHRNGTTLSFRGRRFTFFGDYAHVGFYLPNSSNKIFHMAVHETPTLGFLSARAELWPILMQDSRRQQSVAANVASAELPIDGGPRNAWHASRPHVLAALAVTATYCT